MTERTGFISRLAARRLPLSMIGLVAGLAWTYWPILGPMVQRWSEDARYSHGFLVPVFAAALLWMRRQQFPGLESSPNWWGIVLIAAGVMLRMAGSYIYFEWLEAMSMLPSLAGLCVLFGGWKALRWAGPAIAFLAFMVPLPHSLELALGGPLQRVATVASTYALQTAGLPALGEGNTIVMNEARIGVVEACSGLSMMILFFALATAVAMLSHRPLLDRIVIIASAVPIALIANITRITITGILHETVGERIANIVFHDLAGWLMMPIALTLLGLELWLLSWLLYEIDTEARAPVMLPVEAASQPRTRKKNRVQHVG